MFQDGKPVPLTIRRYTEADFDAMIDIQRLSFPPPFPSALWWNKEQLTEHVSRFPEGALMALSGDRPVGSMTGLRLPDEALAGHHSWERVTDGGYIRNHDPLGGTLYVVDLCVVPAFRQAGVGKWLMQTMYETVVHLGLDRLLGGGRMPGYHAVAPDMTAEAYLEGVVGGSLRDPVISFLLRCGRVPVGVVCDYLEDEQSCNYAALMEWRNPFRRA